MVAPSLPPLPPELSKLRALALDLRWTWSHEGDEFWGSVATELWEETHNPWVILQSLTKDRLAALAADVKFGEELNTFAAEREQYLRTAGWFKGMDTADQLAGVAYFSMEFGLGEALPLYAGGLGVLAGDYLKTASDLDVPVIGVGLLYQQGYFRQVIDASGRQHEFYPYNDPAAMPIEPVIMPDGDWLGVRVELPGRDLQLRVWRATVGRATLYLLDSNHQLNSPPDRGITATLYEEGIEIRLLQEMALGFGGWRVIEILHPNVEVCHINEGHAAFAIIERARQVAMKADLDFNRALWATRAGNIFTTHTPAAVGIDRFPPELVRKYLSPLGQAPGRARVATDDILDLGRINPLDDREPLNMAYLAIRGSAMSVGVSRLHGEISRQIFQPVFGRWPPAEVPVGHVTNGVHFPTWDSAGADRIWTETCGKERWRAGAGQTSGISSVSDEALWAMRGEGRRHLVAVARKRLASHLRQRGLGLELVREAGSVLDPNLLTIGVARRFTDYKRPNLLLKDLDRLERLLLDESRPVQIVIAGKAHSADIAGKNLIAQWIDLARQPRFRRRVVFLEDYDIALAQDLVQGVDLWVNTPRRPWEACGTSGMKVLVNGGLNCSVRDGWWDEAFEPDLGWAIGGPREGAVEQMDARDAQDLLDVIESRIVPEFYDRDNQGMPRAWLARIRQSMARLTPVFSSARMMREYLEKAYVPLAQAVRERASDGYAVAMELDAWATDLRAHWSGIGISAPAFRAVNDGTELAVNVALPGMAAAGVRVEAYATVTMAAPAEIIMLGQARQVDGVANTYVYAGMISKSRPSSDYTVRVVAQHPKAFLPAELSLIAWQR